MAEPISDLAYQQVQGIPIGDCTKTAPLDYPTIYWRLMLLADFCANRSHSPITRKVQPDLCVVDNYSIHRSKDVEKWLGVHLRFELLWLPTYCPRANPIERAFGDVSRQMYSQPSEKTDRRSCGRHQVGTLRKNGPWRYKLSDIYYDREIENEVKKLKNRTKTNRCLSVPMLSGPI